MEYTQDRLRAEIRYWKERAEALETRHGERLTAEIAVAAVCLIVGFICGLAMRS